MLHFDLNRFNQAIQRFDDENALDPHRESADGREWPAELLYAMRLTEWVKKLAPQASEALLLAARSQHLCRWQIPRNQYPMTRAGYLKWRSELKIFHARKSAEILQELGYSPALIERVRDLNLKKHFPQDEETRVLEDALCLVFLQYQLGALAAKSTEEKIVNALRKSWGKMTPIARQIALNLDYRPQERALLEKALNEGGGINH